MIAGFDPTEYLRKFQFGDTNLGVIGPATNYDQPSGMDVLSTMRPPDVAWPERGKPNYPKAPDATIPAALAALGLVFGGPHGVADVAPVAAGYAKGEASGYDAQRQQAQAEADRAFEDAKAKAQFALQSRGLDIQHERYTQERYDKMGQDLAKIAQDAHAATYKGSWGQGTSPDEIKANNRKILQPFVEQYADTLTRYGKPTTPEEAWAKFESQVNAPADYNADEAKVRQEIEGLRKGALHFVDISPAAQQRVDPDRFAVHQHLMSVSPEAAQAAFAREKEESQMHLGPDLPKDENGIPVPESLPAIAKRLQEENPYMGPAEIANLAKNEEAKQLSARRLAQQQFNDIEDRKIKQREEDRKVAVSSINSILNIAKSKIAMGPAEIRALVAGSAGMSDLPQDALEEISNAIKARQDYEDKMKVYQLALRSKGKKGASGVKAPDDMKLLNQMDRLTEMEIKLRGPQSTTNQYGDKISRPANALEIARADKIAAIRESIGKKRGFDMSQPPEQPATTAPQVNVTVNNPGGIVAGAAKAVTDFGASVPGYGKGSYRAADGSIRYHPFPAGDPLGSVGGGPKHQLTQQEINKIRDFFSDPAQARAYIDHYGFKVPK